MLTGIAPTLDDISTVIGSHAKRKLPVKLTKQYKGIELNQPVRILEANKSYAVMQATNLRMCAALEGNIRLNSQLFPKPVIAHIEDLNVLKGMFTLSSFAYMDSGWKERQHERVQPEKPTYVTLRFRRRMARACLDNLSARGMGLLVDKDRLHGMEMHAGVTIHLDCQMPGNTRWNGLKGMVVYIKEIDRWMVKLGIQLFPGVRQSREIEAYIARRKEEIMGELNQAYIRAGDVECVYI